MNNFFSVDLIFFIMIAAILVLRLRSVLGKRTGNEKKSKNNFSFDSKQAQKTYKDENIVKENLKQPKLVEENINNMDFKSKTGLEKINTIDKSFSSKEFLAGAKEAFESIVEAYAKSDFKTLKNLLNNKMFKIFSDSINKRNKKNNVLEHTFISFKNAEIKKISVKSSIAEIVVKFVTEQVNLLKNSKGKIIEGNPEYIEDHIDNWTFSKDLNSGNPNWNLTDTETAKS